MLLKGLTTLAVLSAGARIWLEPVEAELEPSETITRYGHYTWNSGKPSDLRAVFTPDGNQRWRVDFYFRFRGQRHVYSGTAQGNLDDGRLQGQVTNESGARSFSFEGWTKDQRFNGTHAEISRRGRTQPTGKLELRP